MEFQEKYKVDIARFSSGSTGEVFTPYYDMKGYRRVDFLFGGLVNSPSSGALGATDYGEFTLRAMQASNSTGGGASAISSATAVVGKESATGFSATRGCREGMIYFSTISGSAALEVYVGTAMYFSDSVAAAAAPMTWVCGASAEATVAVAAFVAMFNGATNTATAVSANWKATANATVTADRWVRIVPKDRDSTHQLRLGTTGSSQLGVGGVFSAHIGIDAQHMADGKRYVSLGIKSTEFANPYSVTIVREPEIAPAKNVFGVDKTLNSASK